MYHHQEYHAKRLSPVWRRIVTLIEQREYNQAREELEFLYRDTNRIISILEKLFKPQNAKKSIKRQTNKKKT